MLQALEISRHLKKGQVYRRTELANWSKAIDRDLAMLVKNGTLEKLSQGLYYYPKHSVFGKTPPEERVLVSAFLKDHRFLLTSFNVYNDLGVGTIQLYNKRIVYNHKRHGEFKIGNRKFDFRVKSHFPKNVTPEFLLVDLVNNLDELAEDKTEVLQKVRSKLPGLNRKKIEHAVTEYGSVKTKKIFTDLLSLSQ